MAQENSTPKTFLEELEELDIQAEKENNLRAAAMRVIASLAYDIRGCWNEYVKHRVRLIEQIARDHYIGIEEIDLEDAEYDGRWFRDVWNGPYGAECTVKDLELLGLDKDIFNYPEYTMATEKPEPPN